MLNRVKSGPPPLVEMDILDELVTGPKTIDQIAEAAIRPRNSIRKTMYRLRDRGLARKIGETETWEATK